MITIKLIILLTTFSVVQAFPRKYYKIDPEKIDPNGRTVLIEKENNALGTCTCDITKGSCDAYCCCDKECTEEI